MNRHIRARRAGSILVGGVAIAMVVSSCGINADNPPSFNTSGSGGYTIGMEFTSALNLPAQAKVLSNGADIGTVKDVTYENGHALVKAQVKSDSRLPADSRAELRQDTLLGEIYVSILPPSEPTTADMLKSGSVIPLSRTEPAANVEDVMRGMANVLGGGELSKVHTAISTLNTAFPRDPKQFDALYRTTLTTLSEVSANTDKLDVVLSSADRTLKVVLADPAALDRVLIKGGRNFYGLGYTLIDVALLIANLRDFSTAAGAIVDPENSRIVPSVAAIAPVVRSLANSDIYSKAVTEQATRVIRDKLIPFVGSPNVNVSAISVDGRDLSRRDASSFITVLKSIGMLP
ncbi:MAG: MlaD family protein [Corynebacteriales bacterium]|nr:MlaD family protein [Mycobacteriales bacterium]